MWPTLQAKQRDAYLCTYFRGLCDQYTSVTRYPIVLENQSQLYSQTIYIVYDEKTNKQKNQEKNKQRVSAAQSHGEEN